MFQEMQTSFRILDNSSNYPQVSSMQWMYVPLTMHKHDVKKQNTTQWEYTHNSTAANTQLRCCRIVYTCW